MNKQMWSRALTTLGVMAFATIARGDLIISEIFDATLPGGLPKVVELTNTGCDSVELSAYSIGNFNNGGIDLGGGAATVLPAIGLAAGDSFVIAYENAPTPPATSVFEDTFGFVPDLFTGPFINGDDVVALFLGAATGDGSDATLVEVYGVIGVDGSGMAWEYTDGYSFRNSNVTASNAAFDEAEWTFGGVDSLQDPGGDDAVELQLILDNTTPGAHDFDLPTCGPSIIINEVDADTPGTDMAEFIELYDGGIGNTPLDGLVVVLFNGSDDQSYTDSFDLDGFSTDVNGYFVLGNDGLAEADLMIGASNVVQNGADAVALYADDAVNFPNDTPITLSNLLDAIVYDTNDGDDAGLLVLLNAGQPQVNEGGGPSGNAADSNQRCPNGSGGSRNTSTYAQNTPTPGADNNCAVVVTGACCDTVILVCADDVLEEDCIGANDAFSANTACADLDPPCAPAIGACCDTVNLVCADDVLEADCNGANDAFTADTLCADLDPPCEPATGACCTQGVCADGVTADDCANGGGEYQGDDSTCGASASNDGTLTTSVDEIGSGPAEEYYGTGNDDNFVEYGVTTFNFTTADFGVGTVADITTAQLTVTVNDRFFSDGNAVEFFFTTDTDLSGLIYDIASPVNGIDATQFTYAPVSLGVFAIPEMAGRPGGETDTLDLDLSGVEADLIDSINAGTDFQIIVAATDATHDITYSGVGNTFDPGDPNLTITLAEGGAECTPLITGACCNTTTFVCTDDVLDTDCVGADEQFTQDVACADLDPPCQAIGACCFAGSCADGVAQDYCTVNGGTFQGDGSDCAAGIDCGDAPGVVINEIRIDQPGGDDDEYFELFGDPNASLDGLWYVVIGDSTDSVSGNLEAAVSLAGNSMDANGYFVAAEASFTLGTADLTTDLAFENSDNVTHLLVAGLTAATTTDLDTDDDCTLDLIPWAGELDRIALVEEDNPAGGTECHYGPPQIGPDGMFVPGNVKRCPDGTGAWTFAPFDPAGGEDTPGAANICPTGACCDAGACSILTQADCENAGGTYNGNDSECEGDADTDGVDGNCGDDCPFDPDKTEPGICGCGFADVDSDDDGFLDCQESCDLDPNKQEPGICGCGVPDDDSDGDSIADCNDQCPGEDDTIDDDMNGVPDCTEVQGVPTVSTWGLLVLALLLASAAKVYGFRREFA